LAVENHFRSAADETRSKPRDNETSLAPFALFCLTLAGQSLSQDKLAALASGLAEEVTRRTTPVQTQRFRTTLRSSEPRLQPSCPPIPQLQFSVVATGEDNPLHEPLAIPGGYIFVPSNLLLNARDEAEFAGMLAQAIARAPVLIQSNTGTIPIFFWTVSTADRCRHDRSAARKGNFRRTRLPFCCCLALVDPAALFVMLSGSSHSTDRALRSPLGRSHRGASESHRGPSPASYSESDEFYALRNRCARASAPPTLFRNPIPPNEWPHLSGQSRVVFAMDRRAPKAYDLRVCRDLSAIGSASRITVAAVRSPSGAANDIE